jgi:hypothetical protein
MNEAFLTLRCPNCGEPIELAIRKSHRKPISVDDVKEAIKEWINQVDVSQSDGSIVINPKEFLGKKLWQKINIALQEFNAEWISAGKESRWMIKG